MSRLLWVLLLGGQACTLDRAAFQSMDAGLDSASPDTGVSMDAQLDASPGMDSSQDVGRDSAEPVDVQMPPDVPATPDAPVDTCIVTQELCDGIDNDCNPFTPDGIEEPDLEQPCDGDDADSCAEGSVVCFEAQLQCVETAPNRDEECDAVDNDCDDRVDEGAGLCGTNCRVANNGASSYIICSAQRTWTQARTWCQQYPGYDLVVINDQAEHDWLWAEIGMPGNVFIGLSDRSNEGDFVWVDGTVLGRSNNGQCSRVSSGGGLRLSDGFCPWDRGAGGEPNDFGSGEDCVLIGWTPDTGLWNDGDCSDSFRYVCEAAITRPSTFAR